MAKSKEFKFFAEHFWKLMEKQQKKCSLTGRILHPINTEVELVNPLEKDMDKRKALDNHYLVDKDISHLSRYLCKSDIIKLCKEVLKHQGYTIKKEAKKL